MKTTYIRPSTRLRVIVNGVVLNNVTMNELDRMLGNTNQRWAVQFAVDQMNVSTKACTGMALRHLDVDVQIDLQRPQPVFAVGDSVQWRDDLGATHPAVVRSIDGTDWSKASNRLYTIALQDVPTATAPVLEGELSS